MRRGHWIGFAHLSVVDELDEGWTWYARVIDALPYSRSQPVIDALVPAAVAPGSGINGGLELCGVERFDGAGVVPDVDSGGRVEL